MQITASILIETRKNATKLFNLSDETFNQIAFFIKLAIIILLNNKWIGFRRNDLDRAFWLSKIANTASVSGLTLKAGKAGRKLIKKCGYLGRIRSLTRGQEEPGVGSRDAID